MANLGSPKLMVLHALQFVLLVQIQVSCYQYKIGDLDAWGIPTSANPKAYYFWSNYHTFKVGDSLLFLYPPSQDSLVQVTEQNYNSCNLTDPILYMNDGNSLFNLTSQGDFYFTSGIPGHCEKKQKLQISVGNESASSPSSAALPDAAAAHSYSNVFGTIPMPPSSSRTYRFSIFFSALIGAVISAAINSIV